MRQKPVKDPPPYFKPSRNALQVAPFQPPFAIDGYALQEWSRLLAECHWLRESEASAIADRCLCAQRLIEAEQDICRRGSVCRTRNGMTLNASIRVARSYRASLMRLDVELGLTPQSRERLGAMASGDGRNADDVLELKLSGDWPPPKGSSPWKPPTKQ